MTLYILYGFSKALEFGVEVPRPVVERAWPTCTSTTSTSWST